MKTIVMDLDGTLTIDEPGVSYDQRKPRIDVIEKLRAMRDLGFKVVISTARNMNTFQGNVGLINVKTLPVVLGWLDRHAIPYDEVLVGKPWCGTDGFYVDDKAIRPEEFTALDLADIQALVGIKPQS